MSTWVYGQRVTRHYVDVPETTEDIARRSHALVEHHVDWPHMWHPGDRVEVCLSDGALPYAAVVLAVSTSTKKVLIQLL